MKKTILSLLLAGGLSFSASLMAQGTFGTSPTFGSQPSTIGITDDPDIEDEVELTMIQFEETVYDFGTIQQGDVVKHTFIFKNIGDYDAIIENVKPSCGCTELSAPEAPIKPGETGEISIQFNSAGKSGNQDKNVTVIYNGNPRFEQVFFKGVIIVPEGTESDTNEDGTLRIKEEASPKR